MVSIEPPTIKTALLEGNICKSTKQTILRTYAMETVLAKEGTQNYQLRPAATLLLSRSSETTSKKFG